MYNKFVTSDGGKKDLRCLTMNTGKLLEVRNLQKFYNKDGVPTKALNGITFDVFPETNCQGLFNQIHKKSTKKVPEALYGS